MYVCLCHGVTDKQIKAHAAEKGGCRLTDIRAELGVASQCGKCAQAAKAVIDNMEGCGNRVAVRKVA